MDDFLEKFRREVGSLTGLSSEEVWDKDLPDSKLKNPDEMSRKELVEEVKRLRQFILRW